MRSLLFRYPHSSQVKVITTCNETYQAIECPGGLVTFATVSASAGLA
ncbi:hypothetical protein CPCC7001_2703 [Cyanobium sp. PCC 7001]|nr:hypothetical protein CPCC7001_2703 [Cyanobium sp. PCC 7001]